jgi:hypothetical protein
MGHHLLAHAGGDMTSLTLILPLLWLGLGTLFMMIAFTDKTEEAKKRAKERPRTLPTPGRHPLGQIHSALVTSRRAAMRQHERERVAAATGDGPQANEAPKRPAPRRHGSRSTRLKRVL